MKKLAIIPARSGSKGLKNKNILELDGMPLMGYSIKAALESEKFDEVMVSTDSNEYAEIAKKCGANVPFLRSEKMSSDTASSWDAVQEVINNYKEKCSKEFDVIVLLQPTSPLRDAEDIVSALSLFESKKAHAVVSVCETEHSPKWMAGLTPDLRMDAFANHSAKDNRQAYETVYRLNGAIYILDMFALDNVDNLYKNDCYAYVMEQEKSVDIDTALDFKIAEVIKHEKSKTN